MAEQWKEFDKINLSFIFKKETPFFLYDFPKLEENLRFLRKFFHQLVDCETKLYYSSKCNPNHVLLSFLAERVDGFDCSSEIEILMMNGLRVSANRISISGPGKTDEVLALASREATGCLHLDSVDEYESLIEWRRGHHIHSQTPPLSLRLQLESEGSKLGMTEHEVSELLSKARPGEFAGLHTYLGREMFSFERFTQHLRTLEQLIARFQSAFVSEVKIFLGPGLPSMKALRNMELPKIPLKCSHPIVFEIGRSLVADAGYYAAPILTKKETRHPTIIVNGGVHHLGSPLVSVYSRGVNASMKIMTTNGEWREGEEKAYSVYGSLCLSHDCLHPRVKLPKVLSRGDWLMVSDCGAYGLTAAVPFFIGQALPTEYAIVLDEETSKTKIMDVSPKGFLSYHESFSLDK